MSIWGTWLSIEHPDDWIADLNAQGIDAGVIGDDTDERELGSPIVYQGSHVLPEPTDARGGSVDVAAISAHVRYWRENPDGDASDEPDDPPEPYLRLGVHEKDHGAVLGGDATVILTRPQVVALHATLTEWLARVPK